MAKLKFGLRIPAVHPIDVEAMRRFVLHAETLGFDSIWAGDHVFYRVDVPQPLHVLTWVAAQTSRIKLGTAIMLGAFLNPVHLARSAATLDALSGGRLTLGLSIGGTEAEYASIGVPMDQRVGRLLENVAIMRALWQGDDVSFAGRYRTIENASIKPKPVQKPIPVYFGSQREPMLKRIGRLADGWMSSAATSTDAFLDGVKQVRGFAGEKGRDPDSLGVAKLHFASIAGTKAEAAELAHRQWDVYYGRPYNLDGVAHGTVAEVREELARFRDAESPEVTVAVEPPGLELAQLDLLTEATRGL